MADKKISELTAATSLLAADAFLIARNGDNLQVPASVITALIDAVKNVATPVLPFRNRVINGNFTINQRNVILSVNNAIGSYANSWLDGWKAGSGGANCYIAPSGIDNLITINSGSIYQVIRANQIEGGSYTISWTGNAKCKVWVGTSGMTSVMGSSALSEFTTSPITVTHAANTNLIVEFNAGTVTRVQVEPGTAATTFERRDDEMQRCQKRFMRFYTPPLRGAVDASSPGNVAGRMAMLLPVRMDAVPTCSVNGNLYVWDGSVSSVAAVTTIGAQYNTVTSIEATYNLNTVLNKPASGGGWPALMYNNTQFTPGYIDVSCEP